VPPRDWLFRIQDILDAIAKIERATRGMDAESFMQSEVVRDAVERNLFTIGEAARAVPEDDPASRAAVGGHARFPERARARVLRISTPRLWETIEIDLPHLVAPLTAILRAEG
jgi:uncharacterized protein with HEPN domain